MVHLIMATAYKIDLKAVLYTVSFVNTIQGIILSIIRINLLILANTVLYVLSQAYYYDVTMNEYLSIILFWYYTRRTTRCYNEPF